MTTPNAQKPYNRAVLFSGGGLRFGYYLGIYQALCDHDAMPDIVIASCGGSFVAGLLEISGSTAEAYAHLLSCDCYEMLCRITPKPPKRTGSQLYHASQRLLINQVLKNTAYLTPSFLKSSLQKHVPKEMLHQLHKYSIAYIADEGADMPFWSFANTNAKASDRKNPINSIILASRLIATQHSVRTAQQWQLVLRCSSDALANKLNEISLTNPMHHYHPKKIHAEHWIDTDMPLGVAVRASISDMYYLPPLKYADFSLLGGVLNLTPIELACQMANTVYAEAKTDYDTLLAEPAIHQVFGFSANQRLQAVRDYQHPDTDIHWMDTTDNSQQLRPAIGKKFRWTRGYIDAIYPTFTEFQDIMRAQYDYGYQRAAQQFRL